MTRVQYYPYGIFQVLLALLADPFPFIEWGWNICHNTLSPGILYPPKLDSLGSDPMRATALPPEMSGNLIKGFLFWQQRGHY
jgi:hypothetical protein